MKVVIQNGSNHPLSRSDAESLFSGMSDSWSNIISNVTLYRSENEEIYSYYYNKSKVLGIFSPETSKKEDVINIIYIALGCLKCIGDIPKKIPASKRKDYMEIGMQEVMSASNAL